MSHFVCYIPSYNDSHFVQESLASIPDWDVVISDNASDEPHRSALRALSSSRVQVIRQEKPLGRVGNWKFCASHFVDSGSSWMKFMVAGDVHKPGSLEICRRTIDAFPDARFITFNIEIVWPEKRETWASFDRPFLGQPAQALFHVAKLGNVFHSLGANLIHADVLRNNIHFGEDNLSYCADLLFLMSVAKRTPNLHVPEVLGEFIFSRRKNFQTGRCSLEHFLEEGLIRLRAADALLELTGDRAERNRLVEQIVEWVATGMRFPLEQLAGDVLYTIPPLG